MLIFTIDLQQKLQIKALIDEDELWKYVVVYLGWLVVEVYFDKK